MVGTPSLKGGTRGSRETNGPSAQHLKNECPRPPRKTNKRMTMSQELQNATQFDEKQVARLLSLSVKTVQKFRANGSGPKFIRISPRCVRYVLSDILEWQAARRVSSTSEPCPGDVSNTPGKARRVK